MNQSEIKTECEFAKDQIKMLQDRIERLKTICKHPNTFEGNYSWRIGSIVPATICCDCGEVVSNEWGNWEKLAETNREEV